MQKWILAIAMALNIITANAQSHEERVKEYINTFKDLAMREQQRSGIPASITLAQGIHETQAGKSELATNANNHFGIKCKKSWTGQTYAYTDDAPDECFRKYPSAEQSYIDHSDYLKTSPRYAVLFTYPQTDYTSWAFGLRKCGYATNPRYGHILVKIIEDYKLHDFTYAAMGKNTGSDIAAQQPRQNEVVPEDDAPTLTVTPVVATQPLTASAETETATVATTKRRSSKIVVNENPDDAPAENPEFPPYGQVVKVNGLKAVYARKGDMPLEYALKTNVRYEKLLEINDISDRPLPEDMYLYLERKHLKGIRPVHIVKEGETIASVSRYEGMSAKSLRSLNKLGAADEPVPGTVLQLQTEAPAKPQLLAKSTAAELPAPPPPVEQPVVAEATPPAPPVVEAVAETTVPATPPPAETPAATTPVEENTLAGNTAALAAPAVAMPDPPPATPSPAEVVATESTAVNPPAPPPVNIANEKPIEEIIAQEKKAEAAQPALPAPEPAKQEEPKDELDALKARFDKVVYAKRNTTPPAATPAPETKPAEAPVASASVAEPKAQTEEAPKPTASAAGGKFYTVKKGDTAFSIAKRNNITMRQLMDWNNLDFEAIKIGQRLRVQQ